MTTAESLAPLPWDALWRAADGYHLFLFGLACWLVYFIALTALNPHCTGRRICRWMVNRCEGDREVIRPLVDDFELGMTEPVPASIRR